MLPDRAAVSQPTDCASMDPEPAFVAESARMILLASKGPCRTSFSGRTLETTAIRAWRPARRMKESDRVSTLYEASRIEWAEREELAERMIPLIGRLYRQY